VHLKLAHPAYIQRCQVWRLSC